MPKCKKCTSGGLFTRVNSEGLCAWCAEYVLRDKLSVAESEIEKLKKKVEQTEARITPEMKDAEHLAARLTALNAAIDSNQSEIQIQQIKIQRQESELDHLSKQIISARDAIELESYSLYEPKYAFTTSAEYKVALDGIREQQKLMIRTNTAATCKTTWDVNGDFSQGRKFAKDITKLLLRSFNTECDGVVSSVKFSNFDRCLGKIEKAFDTINNLGAVSRISISAAYRDLKIKELHLAHEYAVKKQIEKDEQAEIRRQQRELAKLEKEIAEARKAAEKERSHYEKALAAINAQIVICTDAAKLSDLMSKRQEIQEGLASVELKLEDIDYRQSNQRAGYVYIISNLGAFGENVYKIGMTRRLDPMERVHELGDASVPFKFDVHAMIFSADAPALEAALHHAFDDRRLNKVNRRREYFHVTLDEIKEVVRQNHDKTVEFKDVCEAEQYRESLRMP